jgi:fatty acid desaturase
LPAFGRELMPKWRRTDLARSICVALGDTAALVALVTAHLLISTRAPTVIAVVLYIPVIVLMARAFRGLEVLVHEGSHYNWTRKRATNDRIVNLLAAYPVFQTVEEFRIAHAVHHKQLGATEDPCRKRFFQLKWDKLSRESAAAYLRGMVNGLGRYAGSWLKLTGSTPQVILWGLLWHLVVLVLPIAGLLMLMTHVGTAQAVVRAVFVWAIYVAPAFLIVLTVLRYIAESAKHDYVNGTTTKTGTYSNIGPVHWVLHPHGDGYHFLHHVDANVPHHRLRTVHRILSERDPEYATSRVRVRVLEEQPLYQISIGGGR